VIYCDTSLLVAALTSEAHSAIARSWLLAQDRGALAISDWTLTEFSSAIAMKFRRGAIDRIFRDIVEHAWTNLRADFALIPLGAKDFLAAADLVDAGPKGLRAGDALHMAAVLNARCDLATFDIDFAAAATSLGVPVHPARS